MPLHACGFRCERCHTLAETAGDERVCRLCWFPVRCGPSWPVKAKRLQRSNAEGRLMVAPERPKSRLEARAPRCINSLVHVRGGRNP
jgi:hypothetical protein